MGCTPLDCAAGRADRSGQQVVHILLHAGGARSCAAARELYMRRNDHGFTPSATPPAVVKDDDSEAEEAHDHPGEGEWQKRCAVYLREWLQLLGAWQRLALCRCAVVLAPPVVDQGGPAQQMLSPAGSSHNIHDLPDPEQVQVRSSSSDLLGYALVRVRFHIIRNARI